MVFSSGSTAMIVALLISKSDPRRFLNKYDGKELWLSNLTLRDSAQDMINLTICTTKEEAQALRDNFHVGEVVEVVRPRIVKKEAKNSNYCPQVTSWLELKFQAEKTALAHYLGNPAPYQKLLRFPTKASSTFLNISDILNNSGSLKGHFVDILAGVRSVGLAKSLPSRETDLEGERTTREVKLFDHTGDSLVLKLWESELIRMSSEWIPRENILFIADARIDFDKYKNSFVVSSSSKTVITVNPDTQEALNLSRYAQTVDFSTKTRMDRFIASTDLRHVDRVLNISTMQRMLQKRKDKDQFMIVNIYGFITKFDLDSEDVVRLQCGKCSSGLKPDLHSQLACTNMECSHYQNTAVVPTYDYAVRLDISDETGSLTSVKVNQAFLVEKFGPASQFCSLSDITRTEYKWEVMMRPMRLSLAVMFSTGGERTSSTVIVATQTVSLQEMTSRMPTPAIV